MKENRLLKSIEKIEKCAAALNAQIEIIKKYKYENDAEKRSYKKRSTLFRQNALAVRYVSSLCARGIPLKQAVRLCAFKMQIELSKVNDLVYTYKSENDFIKRRVNYLMCEKLHKKGFSAKKIAEICGFSEKYVFKVLKKVIDY